MRTLRRRPLWTLHRDHIVLNLLDVLFDPARFVIHCS
jgi:hypothetical protein